VAEIVLPKDGPVTISNRDFSLTLHESKPFSLDLNLQNNVKATVKNHNFRLGFYKTYRAGATINSDTGLMEKHSSGHYAFSTTQ
jgi:hypothetical protein